MTLKEQRCLRVPCEQTNKQQSNHFKGSVRDYDTKVLLRQSLERSESTRYPNAKSLRKEEVSVKGGIEESIAPR